MRKPKNSKNRSSPRASLDSDDTLVAKASVLTGSNEKSALPKQSSRAQVERDSAKRLARLGGTERQLTAIPRRRTTRRTRK